MAGNGFNQRDWKEQTEPAVIIVAGHVCLDVIPTVAEPKDGLEDLLTPGKLVDVGPATMATGGAVSNTGLALHRLGVTTQLMGKVGDDIFGRTILDILGRYHASLADGMIVAENEHSSYTLVISPPNVDRIFFHFPGANDTFHDRDVDVEQLSGSRLFHFGYPPLMKRMYEHEGTELASLLQRVKAGGLTTSVDMAQPDPESNAGQVNWLAILKHILPHTDIFLPSLEEILFMLDRDRYDSMKEATGNGVVELGAVDGELLATLSNQLLELGAAIVGLKLGDQGLYIRTTCNASRLEQMGHACPQSLQKWAGRELLAPCFKVDVVGTTGAGDSTIAGFLTGMLKELSLEETLTRAVAVGAFSVEVPDASSGIPTWSDVEQRIGSGWEQRDVQISLDGWKWDQLNFVWVGPHDNRRR